MPAAKESSARSKTRKREAVVARAAGTASSTDDPRADAPRQMSRAELEALREKLRRKFHQR